jgi:hypothetical protein
MLASTAETGVGGMTMDGFEGWDLEGDEADGVVVFSPNIVSRKLQLIQAQIGEIAKD